MPTAEFDDTNHSIPNVLDIEECRKNLRDAASFAANRGREEQTVHEWLHNINNLKCVPPLPEADVRDIAAEVFKTHEPLEYEPSEEEIDRFFDQLERDQADEDLDAFYGALPEEPAPKQSNSIDGSVVISAEREATPSIASEIEAKPKLKSLTHAELKALVRSAPGDLVEGLIPEKSINIFVGNSGLGKTPLHAQMGLCIAAGLPFLGFKTRPAVVLYVDYENGSTGFDRLLDKLVGYLGLTTTPETFRLLQQPASISVVVTEIKNLHSQYPGTKSAAIIRRLGPRFRHLHDVRGTRKPRHPQVGSLSRTD